MRENVHTARTTTDVPNTLVPEKQTAQHIGELLERTTWVSMLSAVEIQAFSNFLYVCTVDAGSTVVRQGDRGGFLGIIFSGSAQVIKQRAAGPKETVNL